MRQHKLLWASSYDRGLNVLLKLWPDIRRKYPDAELNCCYGWDLFDKVTVGNAERQEWKNKMVELMTQKGIKEHGRIGKEELKKLRKECGILAYCSDFTEIFCINAMEASSDGCVPITTNIAALGEFTVGRVVVKGDIYDSDVRAEYLKELLSLMGDIKRWHKLREEGQAYVKDFTWEKSARKWQEHFIKQPEDIKVTIITPTNRRGWWNIMAYNIATQTYQNIEWLIVDDYSQDRSQIAKEYAEKYGINIKYVRGKERKTKRHFGLVNANNTGIQNATGELLIFLQDFVLMPEYGVEDLVNIYRHHPNSLIAPVDEYFAPKMKPDTNSEDWFHGELDVKGEFMRSNIRIQNKGFRMTDHPYDYEQNYGAVPKHIAEDLGGFYEFYDEGLGFDNTDLAFRALKKGYTIALDETNIATCIDHWNALEGTVEHGLGRERRLSDPRFLWEMQMIEAGKLPLTRTQEVDDTIELLYEMPKDVPTEDAVKWIRANMDSLCLSWMEKYKNL